MAKNKTTQNDSSVGHFLHSIEDENRKKDSFHILEIMKEITGMEPQMWGTSIVGFDTYHYKYESGREGDFMIVGFSPRKTALTLYIMPGFGRFDELMQKLGKYKTGKSCLYVKKLSDVNENILWELIEGSVKYMREKYHQ